MTGLATTLKSILRPAVAVVRVLALAGAVSLASVGQVDALGLLFYAADDGQVRGMDMSTGADSGVTIPAAAFFGTAPTPATSRNIAYDPQTDLMWYAASDNNVHSVVVSSLAAGPTIDDINDAFYGAMRTLAIDPGSRRLYISNSNGNVEVYNLQTNTRMYSIHVSEFGLSEPNPGNRRHLAADGVGMLWYAAADGAIKEFDSFQYDPHYTGRELPPAQQIEPSPDQYRYMVAVRWPSGYSFLYYAASDGTVRGASLDHLSNANITYLSAWFVGSTNPGKLRSLTIDPTWTQTGDPPAVPTGVAATDGTFQDRVRVTWNAVSEAGSYALYRRDVWNQWTLWNSGITGTTSDDTWVTVGMTYEYAVVACNVWGCSAMSSSDTGFANDLLPAPTGVEASHGTFDDRVRVSWNPVPGASGYLVGRMPVDGGLPSTVWVTGTVLDDVHALPEGSVWEYWVSACFDPSSCSGSSTSAYGWMRAAMFADGFESGSTSGWSQTRY